MQGRAGGQENVSASAIKAAANLGTAHQLRDLGTAHQLRELCSVATSYLILIT